jgi:hypothetical protein
MKRSLSLLLWLMVPAVSAQTPVSSEDHALIQQLLERVRELEQEVRELKAARPGQAALPTPQPAPALPPAGPPQVQQAPRDIVHDMPMPGTEGIQIRGFSDIRFRTTNASDDHSTFALGQLNLFITSKLSEKFSLLGEVVFEADPTTNVMGVDLERLLFQYTANDYFNLSFGRYHTAIGYYNTAYHHSTWMQTTVDRPFLFAFEDGGGILPIHNVGVTATGRIPSGGLGLHYVAEIGNGRASRSPLDEAVQNVQDENNRKALNLALYARPDWLRNFQAGFSAYRDVLYPEGVGKIGQTIFAGHAVYHPSGFEFLNEAVVLRHAPAGTHTVYHIPAFYSQISKQFGRLRPYFRYEYMNVPRREPLFGDIGLLHGPVTGLRWDFSEFAAFKLEYNRMMRREQDAINALRTSVSFTF